MIGILITPADYLHVVAPVLLAFMKDRTFRRIRLKKYQMAALMNEE
jgi:hypothetical protein